MPAATPAAASITAPAKKIGSVKSVNPSWGLVIVQLDTGSTIEPGQTVYVRAGDRRTHRLTVKRIADDKVSAVPDRDLTGIAAGMPIFSQ